MSPEIIFFLMGVLAYSAALWYEFYKVIRDAKNQNPENQIAKKQ